MSKPYDLSKPLVALDYDSTLIAVIEMSGSTWLVSAIVPGLDRRPLQKLPVDEDRLLGVLERWTTEAGKAGQTIGRVVVAYEAGRDGFWLARWLRDRGVESYVIHATSVAVSREARRAKTDRLDTALLLRAFLGWLRAEPDSCRMVAIPAIEEEDTRRPGRERARLVIERTRTMNRIKANLARLGIRGFKPNLRKAAERLETLRTPEGSPIPPRALEELHRACARLRFIKDQIADLERQRDAALRADAVASKGPAALVLLLAKVRGIGIETAEMLVHEVLARNLRDRRAVARFAGLTGTPDESGTRRRQKGISRAGNARVRQGLIQLAWRVLRFQPDSTLVRWYHERVAGAKGAGRKSFIVALARKLLIALWRYTTTGEIPEGFVLKAA
jgi:transposase